MEENHQDGDKKRFNIDYKDIIITLSLLISVLSAGLSTIRDHESRLSKLETRVDNLGDILQDIKSDSKEIKNDIKKLIEKK